MRRLLPESLLKYASKDPRIIVLSGDLGYKMWDKFKEEIPDQFINCGAAEQAMMDIAVGLALSGKIPVTYTITPFYYRAFETLRTYISHEHLHVIMLGSGRDKDYEHDGFSHDASDILEIMGTLEIDLHFPMDKSIIPELVKDAIEEDKPVFISLRR